MAWRTRRRWIGRSAPLAVALLATGCATGSEGRPDTRAEVDRVARQASDHDEPSPESGERHEGPKAGKPGRKRERERPAAARGAGKEETGESADSRQHEIEALTRELRDIRHEVDRIAARETSSEPKKDDEPANEDEHSAEKDEQSAKKDENSAEKDERSAEQDERAERGESDEPKPHEHAGDVAEGRPQSTPSRHGRWRGMERVQSAPTREGSVKGKVAAKSRDQLVVRTDRGGDLLLVALGNDTLIHREDVRLDRSVLVQGTPVRIRYRPEHSGELRAIEVAIEEPK